MNIINKDKTYKKMNKVINAIEGLNKLPIFGQDQALLTSDSVWERVLRLKTAQHINFDEAVTPDTILDYKSLFSN
jgi:hypothetical protein